MTHAFAGLIACVVTVIFLRLLIKPALIFGWVDIPSGRKRHDTPTPLIGGLAIWAGFSIGAFILYEAGDFCEMLMALVAVMLVGFYDDFRPMRPSLRLALQGVIVLWLALHSEVRLTSLGDLLGGGEVQGGWLTWLLTPFAIIGMINAFNMIDGEDGLAAGMAWVACALLLVMVFSSTPLPGGELMGLLVAMLGALTGFLIFNLRYPGHRRARVFLGDAGSTLIGFLVACFLIRASESDTPVLNPVTALWLVAIPLMDTVALMIRRLRQGSSPFAADRQHLHHLLRAQGLSVERVVMTMLGIGLFLGAIGCLLQWAGVAESLRFYLFLAIFVGYCRVTTKLAATTGRLDPDAPCMVQDEV